MGARRAARIVALSWALAALTSALAGQEPGTAPVFVPAPTAAPHDAYIEPAWKRAGRQSTELWRQEITAQRLRRLVQGDDGETTFQWPMWDAADAPTLLPSPAISNFVDHNPRRGGSDLRDPAAITDFDCGLRTYDGHRGLDIFSWPFNQGKVRTGFVEARAGANGVIIDRQDGNFDRSCSLTSKPANYVILEHADGSRSLYWHLANGSVTSEPIGSAVSAGDVLGEVASSGFSTGPHLHFEIRGDDFGVIDPYSGPCNTLNSESYWQSQPGYRVPRVTRISTHSAEPDFTPCPADERPHSSGVFGAGATVFFAAFLRDLQTADSMEWRIYQPNGALWQSSPFVWQGESFPAGWFWISRALPDLPGAWRYQYDYSGETYETTFHVGAGCRSSERTGCAGGGRFVVEAIWQDFEGRMGYGRAVPLTDDTVYFWFFDPDNVELVVKVLDARALNQAHWVFYGALTNVKYILRILDTESGEARYYTNPSGRFASAGDTAAFPDSGIPDSTAGWASFAYATGGSSHPSGPASTRRLSGSPEPAEPRLSAAGGTCVADSQTLCLTENRFAVTVSWRDFENRTGAATAQAVTSDTGYFWFFDPDNVELILKVLDARALNQKFWVFYGALSNVEYEITVTDTVTGQVRIYTNPLGSFASVGDTAAF